MKKLSIIFALLFITLLTVVSLKPRKLNDRVKLTNIDYSSHLQVPEGFSSFALDMGQVLGGKWWEGSLSFEGGRGGVKTTPFDFNRGELDHLIKPLAPFTLRLGGSEADSVLYSIQSNRSVLTIDETEKSFQTILTKERVGAIKRFIDQNDLDLMFTLNIGPGYRANGKLDYKKIEDFLSSLSVEIPNIKTFELGNEINAFFLNYGPGGQVFMKEYVENYLKVKKLVRKYFPDAKLAGPANAFWPYIGEVFNSFTLNSQKLMEQLKDALDIYSWHYYPTQSIRCPVQLEPSTEKNMLDSIFYNDYFSQSESIIQQAKKFNIGSVWLGESGPAQCGGQPQVSKSIESSLWYYDHLFKTLRTGQKKLIRQTLVGSDYGLINDKDLSVNFDYYVARLFKYLNPKLIFKTQEPLVHSFCDAKGILYHSFVSGKSRTIVVPEEGYELASFGEKRFLNFTPDEFDSQVEMAFREVSGKYKVLTNTINILRTKASKSECVDHLGELHREVLP